MTTRLAILLLLLLSAHASNAQSPQEVVTARMDALNAHDLSALMDLYAEDVVISVFPGTPLTSGRGALRELFASLVETGDAEVTVTSMLASGPFVVVERTFSYGQVSEPGIAVYRVEGGLITHVEFLRDGRRAKRVDRF
ncbi:MAG: nuclear transport factor 2 family protein [Pseudomonadota bacterium]